MALFLVTTSTNAEDCYIATVDAVTSSGCRYYRVSTAAKGTVAMAWRHRKWPLPPSGAARTGLNLPSLRSKAEGRLIARSSVLPWPRQEEQGDPRVAKLDRLARDVELIARLVKEAERNGFSGLLFADFPDVDATTPEGELFINQMAAFAQFEARRISQRTKAGLAVAKSRGRSLEE